MKLQMIAVPLAEGNSGLTLEPIFIQPELQRAL